MRILVAIANHGSKNRRFLDVLLRSYRRMSHEVDIVVLSDTPKDLGPDVEVLVGAPTENPWSLPFAHRSLFAGRSEDYDLYIYSEDDTLIEGRHIDAFLELDTLLPPDEVPGFLRFEVHPSGERSYCSIHSAYRWLPDSVEVRDGEVFASFSNEHSACYMLTQEQLRRAIASGGFLVDAHEGTYDMLVSAATDPYVRCGLRRRLCLTRIDDVLLHHLPNVYLGQMGIEEREFRAQIDALLRIGRGLLEGRSLLTSDDVLPSAVRGVPQYPRRSDELAQLAGEDPGRVLSVGCTSGRLERDTFGPSADITAVPLDEVVAAVAALRDLRPLRPDLREALTELEGQRFDTIVVHQLLQHIADPSALLRRLRGLLASGGTVLVGVPNARYRVLRGLLRRTTPMEQVVNAQGHTTDVAVVRRWAADAGLRVGPVRGRRSPRVAGVLRGGLRALDGWLGDPLWIGLRPGSRRSVGPRRTV